jgi:hypothetical protein
MLWHIVVLLSSPSCPIPHSVLTTHLFIPNLLSEQRTTQVPKVLPRQYRGRSSSDTFWVTSCGCKRQFSVRELLDCLARASGAPLHDEVECEAVGT